MLPAAVLLLAMQAAPAASEVNKELVQERIAACEENSRSTPDYELALNDCVENDAVISQSVKLCAERHRMTSGRADGREIRKCLGIVDAQDMPLEQLEAQISMRHPVDYYTLALRYFHDEGDKAKGLFWFYAGQLRWRARMMCHTFEPGGEGALYGAMFSAVGEQLNGWASKQPEVLAQTIDRVDAWHRENPARYPADKDCEAQFEESRKGMLEFKDFVLANPDQLTSGQSVSETVDEPQSN